MFRLSINDTSFGKEEADSFISKFGRFSEESKLKINAITKRIPLFISYLNDFKYGIREEESIRIQIE